MTKFKTQSRVQFIAPKQDDMPGSFANAQDERKAAFTLAEGGQSPLLNATKNTKAAFTLAEVLITLGIIGVVAAITLPAFMENMNSRVKAKRMENIHQKLSKVTDKMASLDVLGGHASTHDFVYEMKKHMNIAKVCENNNIAECWPISTVDLGDGKTFDISQATTGKTLKATTTNGEDWDNTMGIVTADGTSMIISYNKNCNYDTDAQGLNFDKDSGMSSTLTSGCFAIVYDWNGGSSPNKLGDDVQLLGNAGGLGNACAYKLDNLCIAKVPHRVMVNANNKSDCLAGLGNESEGKLGIKYCSVDRDFWVAAVKECGGVSKMFNESELDKISTYIYGKSISGGYQKATFNTAARSRSASLGLPSEEKFYIWSSVENDAEKSYVRSIGVDSTGWYNDGMRANPSSANGIVMCKGE